MDGVSIRDRRRCRVQLPLAEWVKGPDPSLINRSLASCEQVCWVEKVMFDPAATSHQSRIHLLVMPGPAGVLDENGTSVWYNDARLRPGGTAAARCSTTHARRARLSGRPGSSSVPIVRENCTDRAQLSPTATDRFATEAANSCPMVVLTRTSGWQCDELWDFCNDLLRVWTRAEKAGCSQAVAYSA